MKSPHRSPLLLLLMVALSRVSAFSHSDFGYKLVNSDGTIPRDLMPDHSHLSRRGYELWAEAIEDKLSAVLGDTRVKRASNASLDMRVSRISFGHGLRPALFYGRLWLCIMRRDQHA